MDEALLEDGRGGNNHAVRAETRAAWGSCVPKADELLRLIDSSDDLIWSVDLEFRIVACNQVVREAYRRSRGVTTLLGKSPQELLSAADAERWIGYYRQTLAEGSLAVEISEAPGHAMEVRFNRILSHGKVMGISGFGKDISERKRAESAMHDAQRRYREIFDEAVEGMFQNSLDGRVLAANKALANMLGYDSVEEYQSRVQDVARDVWECASERQELLRKLDESHAVHNYECRFKRKDGSPIWVALTVRWLRGGDHEPLYLEGFCEDISSRKETEKQLRDSEERYRASFEQSAVGIAHTTFEGNWLRCNRSFYRIVGYSAEELTGQNYRQITPPEDILRGEPVLASVVKGEVESASFEKRYIRKDGSLVWVNVTSHLQRDSEGRPLHLVATIQDIDARKQAEERLTVAQESLKKSEERFRSTFEQAALGFLHTSLDGYILRSNEQFARIVGYQQEELAGVPFQAITLPEDRPKGGLLVAKLLNGAQQSASMEKRYIRKDGSLTWVALTISVQRDRTGRPQHFITTVQEINDRKLTEERLAAAQEASRLSEERYRAAFQTILDALAITRIEDGAFLEVNRAFVDASGFTLEEILSHSTLSLELWADPSERDKMIEQVRDHGACRNMEARFRKKSGELFWGLLSASPIELDGVPCMLTIMRDISDAKMAEDEIRTLAFYDPLTGLPNRRLLLERLQQALAAGKRSPRKRALLFVDLDDFKMLNDTLGHQTGDLLLQEVARRLALCTRESDTVARLGGDEFVVMLEGLSEVASEAATQAQGVAEKILAAIAESYSLDGHECRSACSIGITVFGDQRDEISEIMRQADIAMYQAKAAGRNTMHFFAPALQAAVTARAALEEDLRQAIRKGQFLLWYQPQVARGHVVGAEALLRWRHPQRGILAPGEFIRLAEETGLILPLGNWVLEAACAQIAAWSRSRQTSRITVAVNISARQFRQPEFVAQVLGALQRTGAAPGKLKLELTESMLVDNVEDVIAKMSALRAHGLRFSLDDFGTGYSSLAYLQRLPLDQLKIDRSFVMGLNENSANSAIAQAIVSMGRAMHLPVIAEGVETEAQREQLTHMGCHVFQGYLFGRPVPVEEFLHLLDAPAGAGAH
jgi:diguanylate cyclase (GGDEF)-like protein/PAS domain S-box-containing protein